MPVETELKLCIAPQVVEKFLQHPLLQFAIHFHAPHHLCNTYFDTPDCMLLKQGIGLRIRKSAGKLIQSVKTAGSSVSGLHQRKEWEIEIDDNVPDYRLLPSEVLEDIHADFLNEITSLFYTDFTRTTWDIQLEESKIEIALDQGEIRTTLKRTPLCEIELELKSGCPSKLYQLALILQESIPLVIENHSKAARGYALCKDSPPNHHKAGSVGLSNNMNTEQAFIAIGWHCLKHLQSNEDVVLYGDDIEGVHQMRVALRRLRSGLNLYKSVIPRSSHQTLQTEIKWITDLLGVARDWDVFHLTLNDIQTQVDDKDLLQGLQTFVVEAQQCAYTVVRDALHSPRYSRLLLVLGEWFTVQRWREHLTTDAIQSLENPLIEFVGQTLEKLHRKVIKQTEKPLELLPDERHELRILIKKLVYGCRFFAELYSRDATQPYIKSLTHLQDELGILNDGNVANHLLNQVQLSADAPARLFLNGWFAHQQKIHLENLTLAWQTFLQQKTFW